MVTSRLTLATVTLLLAACGSPGPSSTDGTTQGTTTAPPTGQPNSGPVAKADVASVYEGETSVIYVLSNDTDPDGDAIRLMSVAAPTSGSAAVSDAGTPGYAPDDYVVYTPAAGFTGEDTFAYTVEDDSGVQDSASVSVTVASSPNRPPNAAKDSTATPMGTTVVIDPLANDSDPDGDTLFLHSVEAPVFGTVTIDDNGSPNDATDDRILYTPNASYAGPDTILYRVSDGVHVVSGAVELAVAGVAGNTINGVVMKGAVASAEVRLHRSNAALQIIGAPIAQTTTDDNGVWSVPVDVLDETLIVVAAGGRFVNEANGSGGEAIELGTSEILESVLHAGETISVVSVYSNALLERARHFAAISNATAALGEAQAVFVSAYGFDPVRQLPYDPLVVPGPNAQSTSYALILGGAAESLTRIAVELGAPVYDYAMIRALVMDLTDCRLDGQGVDGTASVDIDGTAQPLPSDISLNSQILRFRNNNFDRFSSVALPSVDSSPCVAVDTTPPSFTTLPPPTTVPTVDASGTPITAPEIQAFLSAASAIDDGPGAVTITSDLPAVVPLGTITVTFTGTDASGNTVTAAAQLTVADLTPPIIVPPADMTAPETGALTSVALGTPSVSDNVSQAGNISISNDAPTGGYPPGLTIVTWTAVDEAGQVATAQQSVVITVPTPQAPVLTGPLPDAVATQDAPLALDLSDYFFDPNGDTLTFTASGLPASLAITPSGSIAGTPTNADALAGTFTVTVTADDGVTGSVSDTFILTVANVNDAPVLTAPISDQATTEGAAFTLNVAGNFSDPDGDALSFTASGVPPSLTMSAAGVLSGSPTNADALASPFLITVVASDPDTDNVSENFSLTIADVDATPTISAIADPAPIAEDNATPALPFTVADDETAAGSLTVTASSSNTALIPNGNLTLGGSGASRNIVVTPVSNASGSAIITVTVSDGSLSASETFAVVVNAVNDAPDFSVSGNISVSEDFATTETVTVTPASVPADETGQVVTYSLSPASVSWANVSFNPSTGRVDVTAVADRSGSQLFTITADDGQAANNVASDSFTLTVAAVNDAPTFIAGDLTLTENFAGASSNTVTPDSVPADESGQTVTYSIAPDPSSITWANLTFSAATGQVTVTAVADSNGSQVFTVTADDGQAANNTASDTFTLTVTPVNNPPNFTVSGNISVSEDFLTTETVTVTPSPVPPDESGQVVTYSLSPSSVSWANVSFNSSTGQVDVTAVADGSGSQLFTITADDGQAANNVATDSFTLTVAAVNDAPDFTAGDLILNEDFAGASSNTITPDPVPADETGQTVTYSIVPDPSSVTWANVSFSTATGQITATAVPDASGSQAFTVTANDGQAANNTASDTFTLTINPVNDPPLFTAGVDIVVDEDFSSTETVGVTPGPVPADETSQTVSWSLLPASVSWANVSIDSGTGLVTITGIADRGGTQEFTIVADDGQAANNTATDTFTLTINPINDAPTFTTSGDLVLSEDFNGTQSIIVSPDPTYYDDATQTVTYAISPSPASVGWANVSFNTSNGRINVTAVQDLFGSQVFTIEADDGQAVDNLASAVVTLTVNSVNDPPSFSLSGDLILDANFGGTPQVIVTPGPVPADEVGQVVSYSLNPSSVPFANIGFNASTGQVDVTSVPAATGCQIFTITADDGEPANNTAMRNFSLMVRGGAANEDLNGDGVPDQIQLDAGATPCAAASNVINVGGLFDNGDFLHLVPDGSSAANPTYVLYEPNPTQGASNAHELDLSLLPGSCENIVFYGSIDAGRNLVLDAGAPTTNFEVNTGRAGFIDGCDNIQIYNVGFTGANSRGVEVKASSSVRMENVRIWDNFAGDGGGIWLDDGDLVLRDSVISGNFATGRGGGIFAKGSGSVVDIENVVISGNGAGAEGGGIYFDDAGSSARAFNSLITANRGSQGGGVYFKSPAGSVLSMSTIAYNEGSSGGAVYYDGGGSGPSIQDNIAFGNTTNGGAISTFNGNIGGSHSSFNLLEQAPIGVNDIDITGVGPGWTQGFYLDQATSPGIDSGSAPSSLFGLDTSYTDANGISTDTGVVDRGYHYTAPIVTATAYQEVEGVINQITLPNFAFNQVLLIEPLAGVSKIGRGHRVVATTEGANAGLVVLDTLADVDPLGDGRSVILTDLGDGSYRAYMHAASVVGAPTTVTLRLHIDGVAMPVLFNIDRVP